MKLLKEQLNGISSIIRNYSKFGYIPEFKTFMNLLNDKKFNELLRRDSPMSFLEQYLQDNKGRFCFKSIEHGEISWDATNEENPLDYIKIFYYLGNRGLYPAYDIILHVLPTEHTYGVKLFLYYKES